MPIDGRRPRPAGSRLGRQAERGAAARALPAALRQSGPARSWATRRSCRSTAARSPISTDTFVVQPARVSRRQHRLARGARHAERPGDDGRAAASASPRGSCWRRAFDSTVLDRVIAAMAAAAREAGVPLVAGRHEGGGARQGRRLYINTTGIGVLDPTSGRRPTARAPGDAVLVSGPIGRHGMAIMAAREGLGFETRDRRATRASLVPLVERLRDAVGPATCTCCATRPAAAWRARSTRSPRRRASASVLEEAALPVPGRRARGLRDARARPALRGQRRACWSPSWPPPRPTRRSRALRAHPLGARGRRIGQVVREHPGMVVLRTALGGTRVVDLLPGDQLPRIC